MKVLVQWSLGRPGDWGQIDSRDWARLPKKPEPKPTRKPIFDGDPTAPTSKVISFSGAEEVIDNQPGWIHALNVQGVGFDGFDHYAVEKLDGSGIRVTAWNDDPGDWPDGEKHALVTTFLPLAPDPLFGGAYNTRQYNVIYTQPIARRRYPARMEKTEFRPWADFIPPSPSLVRHGIWASDELHEAHGRKRSLHGWREWIEGVPSNFIENGQVIRQARFGLRPVKEGTKTYYARDTDRAIGAYVASHENAFEATTGTAATEEVSLPKADPATSLLGWAFSTPADEPNSADWPDGTYKFQIDCISNNGVNYGLLTLGTANGKFARVSSDLASELESAVQAEAVFTNTGLKLATVSWGPSAGDAGDRFCCVVACQSTSIHAAKALTLELNEADDYAEGPWAPAVPDNTIYLVKATGKRTQLDTGAEPIRIDPSTGRRSLDTSLTKFLVREDDGTLRAKSA